MAKKEKKSPGPALWEKAKKIIPGGGQLLSKRAEMFLPGRWPSYYKKAKGVDVWGLDGRRYTDMSIMGIGSCVLGYANPGVNKAVKKAVDQGSMSTLNCPEEVELAEKLIHLHPWAHMVRFARTGGEACAVAVRIARAASGKDKVLFCGYHGWADWYISSNLADAGHLDGQLLPGLKPKGVPRALKGSAIPFHYGDIAELEKKAAEYKGKIGAIIMEVQRNKEIDKKFLKAVRVLATRIGAVLVFDEITSGFRLRAGGLHMLHGIHPDIVVLGKAMGNGHPIAAILGKKDVMSAAQETFISSTYWTERVGFAAALEVIRQFEHNGVVAHLIRTGNYLSEKLKRILRRNGFNAEVVGLAPAPHIEFNEKDRLLIETVFTQLMLDKGYLASALIYVSTAHNRKTVERYIQTADTVLAAIAKAREEGRLEKMLKGPIHHSGFKRLT